MKKSQSNPYGNTLRKGNLPVYYVSFQIPAWHLLAIVNVILMLSRQLKKGVKLTL